MERNITDLRQVLDRKYREKAAKSSGPPPDSKYNFLADPSRDEPNDNEHHYNTITFRNTNFRGRPRGQRGHFNRHQSYGTATDDKEAEEVKGVLKSSKEETKPVKKEVRFDSHNQGRSRGRGYAHRGNFESQGETFSYRQNHEIDYEQPKRGAYNRRGSYDSGRRGSYDAGQHSASYDSGRQRGSYDTGRQRGSYDSGRRGRGSFRRGRRPYRARGARANPINIMVELTTATGERKYTINKVENENSTNNKNQEETVQVENLVVDTSENWDEEIGINTYTNASNDGVDTEDQTLFSASWNDDVEYDEEERLISTVCTNEFCTSCIPDDDANPDGEAENESAEQNKNEDQSELKETHRKNSEESDCQNSVEKNKEVINEKVDEDHQESKKELDENNENDNHENTQTIATENKEKTEK